MQYLKNSKHLTHSCLVFQLEVGCELGKLENWVFALVVKKLQSAHES